MQSDTIPGDYQPDKRLHPLSWLFIFLQHSRSALPLFLAILFGSRKEWMVGLTVVCVLLLPILFNALWLYFTVRYGFSDKGLVLREGRFFRNLRTIEYSRIENVDTRRGIFHRLLGVAQVQVETSSGGKAEASINVLSLSAVDEMRELIFARRTDVAESSDTVHPALQVPAAETLLTLDTSELIRYGLINNKGMVVVAAIVALMADAGVFNDIATLPFLKSLTDYKLPGFGILTNIIIGAILIAVLLVAVRLLSIVMALVVFYNFQLLRKGNDLHSEYGLLTRVALTLRERRIQVFHQKATLLHRWFNRVSLQVDLAGGIAASEGAGQPNGKNTPREVWLAPLCPPDVATNLIQLFLPHLIPENLQWQRLAPAARSRIFRVTLWTLLILATAPAVYFTGWWTIAILTACILFSWINAYLYVKHTAWALHNDVFLIKRGWLTRRLSIAPVNRIQSLKLGESPFDRRHKMASIVVDTAGTSIPGRRLEISYLDRDVAHSLSNKLYNAELSDSSTESTGENLRA